MEAQTNHTTVSSGVFYPSDRDPRPAAKRAQQLSSGGPVRRESSPPQSLGGQPYPAFDKQYIQDFVRNNRPLMELLKKKIAASSTSSTVVVSPISPPTPPSPPSPPVIFNHTQPPAPPLGSQSTMSGSFMSEIMNSYHSAAERMNQSLALLKSYLGDRRITWPSDATAKFQWTCNPLATTDGYISSSVRGSVDWVAAYCKASQTFVGTARTPSQIISGSPPVTIADWIVGLAAAELKAPGSATVELQLLMDAHACSFDVQEIGRLYSVTDVDVTSAEFEKFYQFLTHELSIHKRFIVLSADASSLWLRFNNLAQGLKNPF
jgi:hypothetical protein